jgi:hypothetical protein
MTKEKEFENQLNDILKKLTEFKNGVVFTAKDIEVQQDKIRAIDEKWNDGAIKEDDGSIAPGQAELYAFI